MCKKKVLSTVAGVIAVAVLGLASCSSEPIDYFAGYRGANFFSDAGLDLSQFTLNYETHGTAVGDFDYAVYEAVDEPTIVGVTAGLPAGAVVYSFEIPNLLSNGDFESADISQWSASGDGTRSIVNSTTAGAHPIAGSSLDFRLSMDQFLTLDLSTAGVVADGLVPAAEYSFQLELNGAPTIYGLFFSFVTDAPGSVTRKWEVIFHDLGGDDYDTWSFPEAALENGRVTFPESATTASLRIGRASLQQAGTLDNMRLSRSDIRPYIEAAIATSDLSPDRPLVAGDYYEFSLFVKPYPAEAVTPATPDRYRANGITLWINDSVYSEASAGWPVDEWTKVTFQFSLSELSIPDDGNEEAIRVRVSPTLYSDQDAGGLLIAAPELTLNPPEPRGLF